MLLCLSLFWLAVYSRICRWCSVEWIWLAKLLGYRDIIVSTTTALLLCGPIIAEVKTFFHACAERTTWPTWLGLHPGLGGHGWTRVPPVSGGVHHYLRARQTTELQSPHSAAAAPPPFFFTPPPSPLQRYRSVSKASAKHCRSQLDEVRGSLVHINASRGINVSV